MPGDSKKRLLQKRQKILCAAKNYIDENRNPNKQIILDPRKENFSTVPSILEILSELLITPQDYYDALSISNDSDFQIHLKCQPNEYFMNNYFPEDLEAWKANIDIQDVFDHYKAVTYMCVYFSKAENETSEVMKQAAKEAHALGKTSCKSVFYEERVFGSTGSISSNVRVVT